MEKFTRRVALAAAALVAALGISLVPGAGQAHATPGDDTGWPFLTPPSYTDTDTDKPVREPHLDDDDTGWPFRHGDGRGTVRLLDTGWPF